MQRAERVGAARARELVRDVRQLAAERGVSFTRAVQLARAIVPTPPRREYVPDTDTRREFAYNLQDVDELGAFSIAERFAGTGRPVTMTIETVVYVQGPGEPPRRLETDVTFDPGATVEEFYSNYYWALRELRADLPELYEDAYGDEPDDVSEAIKDSPAGGFAILVGRMR